MGERRSESGSRGGRSRGQAVPAPFLNGPERGLCGLTISRFRGIFGVMKTIALLALSLIMQTIAAQAGSVLEIPVKDIDGKDTSLNAYKGKVLLIVNVASKCGLTPQYKALEALQEKYKAKGFTIVAFPCNQFGGQEPGTNEEIKQFCSTKYNVKFPMFDKIEVNGEKRHPLYVALAGEQ